MLLTVRETCEQLRISRTTLYELCRSGQLRSLRIGQRGIRFAKAELERFIAQASSQGIDEV